MKATADLCDEFGDKLQYVDGLPVFLNFGKNTSFHGEISTVSCLEDNSVVKEAIKEKGNGRILVIHGGGSRKRALVGDQIAKKAAENGWSGMVVNGCIRDAQEIGVIDDFGVKALGTIPRKTIKRNAGVRDIEVTFSGVNFRPGDYLVADSDGIVVGPRPLFQGSKL